jgi:asparagine synthase (glutamine-hydrolysing)
MWALILLDTLTGTLLLSRDRFGIKPLYIHAAQNCLFASSEIKGILESRSGNFHVGASAANAYLRQSILCASTDTFFSNIREFPPGHFAKISVCDAGKCRLDTQRYWQIPMSVNAVASESELIETVRHIFIDSVKLRLRSDVPVGVLLSGGTDSSSIAAAVCHLDPSREDIKLISAVGNQGDQDEHPFIDAMAKHLNKAVEKVVLNYPPSRALQLIGEVSWFNDEPIGSFSTVAHYLLMRRAKDLGVTVLLSGQGADETLCGYKKYLGFYLHELIALRKWLRAGQTLQAFFRRGTVLSQFNYQEAKRYLPRWLRYPELDIRGPALLDETPIDIGLNGTKVIARQAIDIEKLSVPALVHYEDRMSMASSREIRLPFLDYRFVSLLVPLPTELKLQSGWTKWIFRRAMEPLLPQEIAWRKDKQPFVVPQNRWLRAELQGEIWKFINTEWRTERLGIVDRNKFSRLYGTYLRQPSAGPLAAKDILAPIGLELWARRFESYLSL